MAASTGPAENNTIPVQTVELGDTFNLWRDVTNTAVYKLNELKVYDFVDSTSISGVLSQGGTLSVSLADNVEKGLTFTEPIRFLSGVTFDGAVTFNAPTVTINANIVTIDDYNLVLGDTSPSTNNDAAITTAGGGGLLVSRGTGGTAEWLWQTTQVHGITGLWRANTHIGLSGPTSGIYPHNGGSLRVHGSGVQIDGGSTSDHGVLFNLTSTGVAGTTSGRTIEFSRYSPSGSTAFIQVLNGSTYGSQPFVNIPAGANRKVVTQNSHGFVFGQPLYLNSTTYTSARADSASTAEVVGLVSRRIDNNNFEITFLGEIFGDFSSITEGNSSLTPGAVYYLSPYTAGRITATQPQAAAQVHKAVLIATSATSGIVYPFTGGVLSSPVNIATASSVGTVFNQLNQFKVGDFVRWTPTATTLTYVGSDAVTYTYNYTDGIYVKAQANTSGEAEVAGMVIATTDAASSGTSGVNATFTLLMDGFFAGISLPAAYGTPSNGTVYFLAQNCAGSSNCLESNTVPFQSTYPTAAGTVRKPLLMATSGNASNWSGYLFSYRGDEAGIQGLSADTRLEDLLVRNMGSCGSAEDLDFGVRTGTGVAGGTKVMRLPYRRTGSVDIGYFGTGTNGASLDVKGVIRGGRATATQGGDILVGRASTDSTDSTYPTTLNVFGSQFSSGNSVISYGTRPRSGALGYESSWSGSNIARAALEVGVTGSGGFAGLALYTVPQNNSTVGTAYSSNLTELLLVNTDSMIYAGGTAAFDGRVGIGTRSPQQPFVVSSSGAAGVEIVPSSGIVQAYNRNTAAYSPLVLDASTATIRVGTSPAAVLTAQSGGVTFNGTTDHAGAARFASTLSVTSTTASSSATTGALVVSGGLGVGGAIYSTMGITSSTLSVTGKATSAATSASDTSTTLSTKGYVESISRIGSTICFSKTGVATGNTITVGGVTVTVGTVVPGLGGTVPFNFPTSTQWSGFAFVRTDGSNARAPTHFNSVSSFGMTGDASNEPTTNTFIIIATRVS